jgi:hypothetical protein
MAESIYVRLTFHDDSTHDQRDADFACLYEKLDELIAETSAFCSHQVLTYPPEPEVL